MKTLGDLTRARDKYRHAVTVMLTMGGLPDHAPQTEREWLLFDVNQRLRDQGVGKPLPWPNQPTPHTAEDILAALEHAGANA